MSRVERLPTTFLISVLLLGSLWLSASAVGQQRRSPVAPGRERVEVVVREAYDKFRSDTGGKNADYIPYLAQVDPKLFGVSSVTTDNQVFNVGDVNYAFSIQSISKVFTLALAMQSLGAWMTSTPCSRAAPATRFRRTAMAPTRSVAPRPVV